MRRLLVVAVAGILLVPSTATADASSGTSRTSSSASKPLRFLLDSPLYEGGETRVRLRNTGNRTYIYNSYYEACQMVFRDSSEREFLIPEGTHCDLVDRARLAPGETVTLFRWDLDECIEDNWGCAKARDLPQGEYMMRGWFRPKRGGDTVRVTRRFHIRQP